ncbi:MAG TPA: UDP-2,3-diacylglucosamine diphosphatase LpxI [Alphaproteobacteria bacterium]
MSTPTAASASPSSITAPRLGIVAGGGALPGLIAAACQASGRPFFVLALEGHADAARLADLPHAWIRLGAAGRGIELLKEAGVEEIVMAGSVRRPSLATLRPDARTALFLAKIGRAAFGDDGLLGAIVRMLEEEGFRVVGADDILGDLVAVEGVYGAVAPDAEAMADIERGVVVARAIGSLDIGQAAVVQQGVVLGVEAIEGTDALIARCAALRREGRGGVLVKVKKPGQETRVDLPVIGATTVANAAAAGLCGIAVEAGAALVIDRAAVVEAADRAGLFVVGIASAA